MNYKKILEELNKIGNLAEKNWDNLKTQPLAVDLYGCEIINLIADLEDKIVHENFFGKNPIKRRGD